MLIIGFFLRHFQTIDLTLPLTISFSFFSSNSFFANASSKLDFATLEILLIRFVDSLAKKQPRVEILTAEFNLAFLKSAFKTKFKIPSLDKTTRSLNNLLILELIS